MTGNFSVLGHYFIGDEHGAVILGHRDFELKILAFHYLGSLWRIVCWLPSVQPRTRHIILKIPNKLFQEKWSRGDSNLAPH
jgi:hypothetical protein